MSLAKVSGLATILFASWAKRNSRKAMRATGDLNANCILRGPVEVADFQRLA